MSKVENSIDVILLLLYAPGSSTIVHEPIKGITRLQKLLFLLWKEGGFDSLVPDLHNFNAYDLGPCLDDIYDDLDFMESINLIKVEEVPSGNEYEELDEDSFHQDFGFEIPKRKTRRDYSLKDIGLIEAEILFKDLEASYKEKLIIIRSRYNSMPFFKLLRYVYKKYPRFAKNSILTL